MKSNLLKVLENKGITTDINMVAEVLKYAEVDSDISNDDIIEELDNNQLDYSGACHDAIDGMIDIYYSDLEKWVVGNVDWIDRAKEELGGSDDFYKMIQAGQYLFYNEEFWNEIARLVNEVENLD